MWLRLGGVYAASEEVLDQGISDSVLVTTEQAVFLVTTTGKYGGLTVYSIGADGTLTQTASYIFPPGLQSHVLSDISVAEVNGETFIFFGATDTTLFGIPLTDSGTFRHVHQISFADLEAAHLDGSAGALFSLTLLSDLPTSLLPDHAWQGSTVAVHQIVLDGQVFTLTLGSSDGQVTSYRQRTDGQWVQSATLGPQQGLGIAAPTAMEIVTVQDQTYLLVASTGGSSISVIAVGPDGSLSPVQHIIDTSSTRLANVQDMAIAQVGDHVFVFAVGADHGVTMFKLLPDGQLIHMETWADGAGGALHTPLTISATLSGDTVHVLIGAQNATGVTHFTVDASQLGVVLEGSNTQPEHLTSTAGHDVLIGGSDNDTLVGSAGNDILVSGPGHTVMTGGAGADTFVIRAHSTTVTITDFRPGEDRLDLTDLPMLRDVGQLNITSTATGAIVTYRDVTVVITSHDGSPLSAEDLFPDGLIGPDSLLIVLESITPQPPIPENPTYPEPPAPIVPDPPPPPGMSDVPGLYLIGTGGRDTLIGGNGDDYIFGGTNHDLIYGVEGNNTLYGGFGHDTIYGGSGDDLIVGGPGNDRMWAGGGNDTIFAVSGNNRFGGGAGDDLLYGGTGNDTIYGGEGNDTIYGNAGRNSLWGMRGDDLIHGGDGDDRIGGGRGDDTIYGHGGNDTIYGGLGDDLIYGGAGDDELWGMDGNDTIYGGTGDDFIHGGRGDDVLDGGPGDDTMVGGPGADVFIFREGHDTLLIQDFSFSDQDMLHLDSELWDGDMTAEEVLAMYGSVEDGKIILDFGDGDVITLAGITNMDMLADHIYIM